MKNIKLNKTNKANRIMAIDYLKAIAVILVISNHSLTDKQQLSIGGPFWISMAVPIFMILSGYTNSMSAEKRKIKTFKQYFNKDLMKNRLSRLLLPYIIIFTVELFLVYIIPVEFHAERTRENVSILYLFFTGGVGAGSYYLPLLIQLLFLFPFMLFSFKKSPNVSTLLFVLIHLAFDVFSSFLPISNDLYRLLVFRYLALIMMGIVMYYYKGKIGRKGKKILLLLSSLSVLYIYMTNYTQYKPEIFSKWTGTSLPTIFLALLFTGLGMIYLEIKNTTKLTELMSKIGRASFHIFLVQKLYFSFTIKTIFSNFNIHPSLTSIISIVVCCSIGISFYYLESKFRKIIQKYRFKRKATLTLYID